MKQSMFTTVEKYFRVDRRDIAFIRFVFEACDNIAILATVDAAMGVVVLRIPWGCRKEAEEILAGISTRIYIEEIETKMVSND